MSYKIARSIYSWIIKAAFQKGLTLGSQTLFWLCYNVLQRGLLQQQWMSELADCKQCQPWPGWCSAVPWLPTKPGAGFPSYQIHLFHKCLEAIKTGQILIRQHINWRTSVSYNLVLHQKSNLELQGLQETLENLHFSQVCFHSMVMQAKPLGNVAFWWFVKMMKQAF